MLVIGVPKARGDTQSIEQKQLTIDLRGDHGFVLDDNNGWSPQIAGLKDGGVYAGSALTAGRKLIAGDNDNVTETMRLTLSGGREYEHIKALRDFIRRTHEFWTTDIEIDPPQIRWWAKGAPREQYALIYDISVAIDPPAGDAIGPMGVTLTIERDYAWHGIQHGSNPKVWYFEKNAIDYDVDDYGLVDFGVSVGTEFLGYQVANNRAAFDSASADNFFEQNQIIIPADSIPGDLPALVCLGINPEENSNFNQYLIGRSAIRGNTIDELQNLLLSDASVVSSTDTSAAADTGGTYLWNLAQYSRYQISFATITAMNERIVWNPQIARGEYAAYIRARQHNGSAGNITMKLSAGLGEVDALGYGVASESDTVSPEVLSGTGNTTEWPVTYMGRIRLPDSDHVKMTFGPPAGAGAGLQTLGAQIYLNAARSTGSGVLYVCDVLLLPVSEQACHVLSPFTIPADSFEVAYLLDNTGYLTHGRPGDQGKLVDPNNNFPGAAEIRGQLPTLLPGVDNRIYVLGLDSDFRSQAAFDMTLRVSIVPRWSGVVDA